MIQGAEIFSAKSIQNSQHGLVERTNTVLLEHMCMKKWNPNQLAFQIKYQMTMQAFEAKRF